MATESKTPERPFGAIDPSRIGREIKDGLPAIAPAPRRRRGNPWKL